MYVLYGCNYLMYAMLDTRDQDNACQNERTKHVDEIFEFKTNPSWTQSKYKF